MATKTQLKKMVKDLMEELQGLLSKVEELKELFEEEAMDIEPYGDADSLTEAQEEKQDWLNESASTLDDAFDTLESSIDYLDSIL